MVEFSPFSLTSLKKKEDPPILSNCTEMLSRLTTLVKPALKQTVLKQSSQIIVPCCSSIESVFFRFVCAWTGLRACRECCWSSLFAIAWFFGCSFCYDFCFYRRESITWPPRRTVPSSLSALLLPVPPWLLVMLFLYIIESLCFESSRLLIAIRTERTASPRWPSPSFTRAALRIPWQSVKLLSFWVFGMLLVQGMMQSSVNADTQRIQSAYKKLLLKNHPDKGGSPYIASKINQAKDLLLGNTQ